MTDREKIQKAATLLVADLVNPPTESDLCKAIDLSEYRLRKGFREFLGLSVGAYLRRERMAEAARLLTESDLAIEGVANEVGFRNPSRFAEAFRNEHSVNPSEFRRRD